MLSSIAAMNRFIEALRRGLHGHANSAEGDLEATSFHMNNSSGSATARARTSTTSGSEAGVREIERASIGRTLSQRDP